MSAMAGLKPQHFSWVVADRVAQIRLTRPERKNPLTFESYAELRDTFRALVYADDIDAVVFLPNGGNFCSGGDVHEIIGPLVDMDMKGLLAFTRMTGDFVKAMIHCGKPIISAVDGVAVGAGAIITMASDIRIATQEPAPAQMPSMAAITTCGQARIALMRSPVMRVKLSRLGMSILVSGPMISCTSPPEQKLPPAPVTITAFTSST